jgi:hypothetical protein
MLGAVSKQRATLRRYEAFALLVFVSSAALTLSCVRIGYDLVTLQDESGGAGGQANVGGALGGNATFVAGAGANASGGGAGGVAGAEVSVAGAETGGGAGIPGGGGQRSINQRLAVPAYFADEQAWDELATGAPTVAMAVVNPSSGAGAVSDPLIASNVAKAQSASISVIGYIYTDYGSRSLTQLQREIDHYFEWYAVTGIFIDQSPDDCAVKAYYQSLFDYVKASSATATVVLSPGMRVAECFADVSDVLVTYNSTADAYAQFTPAGWESAYPPERFWHLIYGASREAMPSAVQLAKQRGVGFVYVTSDGLPNPWDSLPSSTYWSAELAEVAAD